MFSGGVLFPALKVVFKGLIFEPGRGVEPTEGRPAGGLFFEILEQEEGDGAVEFTVRWVSAELSLMVAVELRQALLFGLRLVGSLCNGVVGIAAQ